MAETKAFLLEKINKAIKDLKSRVDDITTSCPTPCSCLAEPINFTDVERMKEAIMADPESLYYLYYLKNASAEWLKVLKPDDSNQKYTCSDSNHKHICSICTLRAKMCFSLKEIKTSLREHGMKSSSDKVDRPEMSPIKGSKSSLEEEAGRKILHEVDRSKTCLHWATKVYRWSSPAEINVHGIDDKVKIMDRLLTGKDSTDYFNTIGVFGVAGVGKTALCQVAFEEEQVKEKFFPRIWVCLSNLPKNPENDDQKYKKEVVKRMLLCLGYENSTTKPEQDRDLQALLMALRQELMGKRYLIVLDDIVQANGVFNTSVSDNTDEYGQNAKEWLAYGLPKGQGGTVIVTTRYRETAVAMVGEKNLLHLVPLEDEKSCWAICLDELNHKDYTDAQPHKETGKPKDVSDSQSSKDEGKLNGHPSHSKKIAHYTKHPKFNLLEEYVRKKCHGLPLLAKTMVKIMTEKAEKTRPPYTWFTDKASTTEKEIHKEASTAEKEADEEASSTGKETKPKKEMGDK